MRSEVVADELGMVDAGWGSQLERESRKTALPSRVRKGDDSSVDTHTLIHFHVTVRLAHYAIVDCPATATDAALRSRMAKGRGSI